MLLKQDCHWAISGLVLPILRLKQVSTNAEGEFEIILPGNQEQVLYLLPRFKGKTVFLNGRENIEIWLLG